MLRLILACLMRHITQAQLTFAMTVTAVGRSYGEITAFHSACFAPACSAHMSAHVFWTPVTHCNMDAYAGMSSTAQAMCEPMLLAIELIRVTTNTKHCMH